jgi:putative acetyltransferase
LLAHLLRTAEAHGLHELYLETGSMAFFRPACALYEKFGFSYCGPFAGYAEDPNSVFMHKIL